MAEYRSGRPTPFRRGCPASAKRRGPSTHLRTILFTESSPDGRNRTRFQSILSSPGNAGSNIFCRRKRCTGKLGGRISFVQSQPWRISFLWEVRRAPGGGALGFRNAGLANTNLELRVRMLVTPSPIGLLVVLFQLGEIAVFAMILFGVHAVCLIFMSVPLMIVVVIFVMVAARSLVILRS